MVVVGSMVYFCHMLPTTLYKYQVVVGRESVAGKPGGAILVLPIWCVCRVCECMPYSVRVRDRVIPLFLCVYVCCVLNVLASRD